MNIWAIKKLTQCLSYQRYIKAFSCKEERERERERQILQTFACQAGWRTNQPILRQTKEPASKILRHKNGIISLSADPIPMTYLAIVVIPVPPLLYYICSTMWQVWTPGALLLIVGLIVARIVLLIPNLWGMEMAAESRPRMDSNRQRKKSQVHTH